MSAWLRRVYLAGPVENEILTVDIGCKRGEFVMFGVIDVETLCSIVGVEMMISYVSPGVKPSKVTDGVETICVSE